MAETITLDQLIAGTMLISKAGNEPPAINVQYTMTDATGKYRREKALPYTPTASEVTTLNAFIAKLIGIIRTTEGI